VRAELAVQARWWAEDDGQMSRRGQLKYKIVRKIRTSKADDYTVERFHHWDMAMAKILVNLESAICCERCEWVSKSADVSRSPRPVTSLPASSGDASLISGGYRAAPGIRSHLRSVTCIDHRSAPVCRIKSGVGAPILPKLGLYFHLRMLWCGG